MKKVLNKIPPNARQIRNRKSLRTIQNATNKENLTKKQVDICKQLADKSVISKSCQTDQILNINSNYWQELAEKRDQKLNEVRRENLRLQEMMESLLEENKITNQMRQEAETLVDVLKEFLVQASEDD